MSKKFIPNGDMDFAQMAEIFARQIAIDPARYAVSVDQSQSLTSIVARFRETLQTARAGGARSQVATAEKEEARFVAEKVIRRIAHQIRNNESIDAMTRREVGLRERSKKPKVLTVPNQSPRLRFVRAIHDAAHVPEHELKFTSLDYKPKPAGAVRLELFVDLIAPEDQVPEFPGQRRGSRPIYLRSFTKSPIRLTPPMAKMPMRVVYWGRWADSAGNVGPMSATAVGWIEGGSHHLMHWEVPGKHRPAAFNLPEDVEPTEQEATIVVALMHAQRTYVRSNEQATALPEPVMQREVRQLEGPATEAA